MIASASTALQVNHCSTENNCMPVDWPLIWARKFRKDLYTCRKTGRGYTPVIKEFIGILHQHPKNVFPEDIIGFIKNAPLAEQERYRNALSLFYSSTVPVKTLHDAVVKVESYSEECSGKK